LRMLTSGATLGISRSRE